MVLSRHRAVRCCEGLLSGDYRCGELPEFCRHTDLLRCNRRLRSDVSLSSTISKMFLEKAVFRRMEYHLSDCTHRNSAGDHQWAHMSDRIWLVTAMLCLAGSLSGHSGAVRSDQKTDAIYQLKDLASAQPIHYHHSHTDVAHWNSFDGDTHSWRHLHYCSESDRADLYKSARKKSASVFEGASSVV